MQQHYEAFACGAANHVALSALSFLKRAETVCANIPVVIYGGARGDPLRVLPVLPVSNAVTGNGGDSTADEIVAHARDLQHRHDFATHRLKAGVFPPAHEIEVYHALAAALPTGPSLGVELDHDKLAEYAEHFRRHGGYADDRDPMRPDWYSIFPERNFADPAKGAMVIKDT